MFSLRTGVTRVGPWAGSLGASTISFLLAAVLDLVGRVLGLIAGAIVTGRLGRILD